MRGLFWGRFNPPHKGHVSVIKHCASKVDELVIAIGSALRSHTCSDPFTGGERILMLRTILKNEGLDKKTTLVQVPDAPNYLSDVNNVLIASPKIDVVFTNRPHIKSAFEFMRYKVEKFPFFERKNYSSAEFKKRVLGGANWKALLPDEIIPIFNELGGVKRIKNACAEIDI